jgi:hypothetical protein
VIDLLAFRAKHPEFLTAPDVLVQAYLDDAAGRIDASVWGIHEDRGHELLTAHLLCLAPHGQFARLVPEDAKTTSGVEYTRLERQVACGIRVF